MKILAIAHIYNEYPYLPDVVAYYKKQGIELYFVDNLSNDGSYEWLIANDIPCSRFDTKESFDLPALQNELDMVVHLIKPDWVIYIAADLYYIFDKKLNETIKEIDLQGFNQISCKCFGALNTGEVFGLPLYKNYFRGLYYKRLIMISKYDESFHFENDSIQIDNPKIKDSEILIVNYGGCKPKNDQDIKLKRSQKAWDKGMRIGIGRHLRKSKLHDWVWSKRRTINLVETEPLIKNFILEN
jgi:hypothetical protein